MLIERANIALFPVRIIAPGQSKKNSQICFF
jgi:hypothetical protein